MGVNIPRTKKNTSLQSPVRSITSRFPVTVSILKFWYVIEENQPPLIWKTMKKLRVGFGFETLSNERCVVARTTVMKLVTVILSFYVLNGVPKRLKFLRLITSKMD